MATRKQQRIARFGALAGAWLVCAAPAASQRPPLALLDQLEPGRWEVRVREPGIPAERICVGNGRRFIQLRHPGAECQHFVVADTLGAVTVQYTCRGRGYGRTEIRRETARLVQISSQGIADGLPFDFSAEARRVGDCAS